MSEYLLAKYRPVADALLVDHGLVVPPTTRDMLAKCVMHARELPESATPRVQTPLPALRKARRHAVALLRYSTRPPSRLRSIAHRCAELACALNSDALVKLALHHADTRFRLDPLLAVLHETTIDTPRLRALMHAIDVCEQQQRTVGRPRSRATYIVRAGCLAWGMAGATSSFTWNSVSDALSGPLPAFLRALISCCNGSHTLTKSGRSPRRSVSSPKRMRGDAIRLSDSTLRAAILACKKADLF